jgi:predicted DNA-binding transcriptional regulator YafY
VRVDPEVSGQFTRVIGDQIIDRPGDGVVVLDFPACEAAVTLLAAFGRAVEVLEPPDVRQRLAEIGRELSSLYTG